MMTNDERKLATASLIPLEIDAASILSLSKGVIFDTIVHNIEHTLSNRRTDPLPWKLTGMSLICDSSRNKKYMQKLQKMQCVPSVICTEIYHSKLVITDSGTMTTPGRKIVIPTTPRKRLTGIIVSRSLDELLHMQPKTMSTVHFIQYKLLSYERIPTREVINGPKLTSVGDKILKTVFDFELTQNNGFPRQLLPVAMISFLRQDGCDLCLSIRNFLSLPEHKTFDKSYLVTSTNIELARLREEQERKDEEEAELESVWEKLQRRQPLADLSKISTDTGNTRPAKVPQPLLRVPPLKIKLPQPEKSVKSSVLISPLDSKYCCALKLERIDLSLYNISNLPIAKDKTANENSMSLNGAKMKTKSLSIAKPHEHHKPLKRLNVSEAKKQSSSSPTDISKRKHHSASFSTRSISTDTSASSTIDKRIPSSSLTTAKPKCSSSSIHQSKLCRPEGRVEKTTSTKKVKRPALSTEYYCSLSIPRIDLSLYDIDLPDIAVPPEMKPRATSTSISTTADQQMKLVHSCLESMNAPDAANPISVMEQEDLHTSDKMIIDGSEVLDETDAALLPALDQLLTQPTDDVALNDADCVAGTVINDLSAVFLDELLAAAKHVDLSPAMDQCGENSDGILLSNPNDEAQPFPDETNILLATSDFYVAHSPDLPILDDDPALFSMDNSENLVLNTSNTVPQDCMIIVECSDNDDDDDDDDDEEEFNENMNITGTDYSDRLIIESLSSSSETDSLALFTNASLTQDSHRLSTSSSCSSLSMRMLHNQSPKLALHLIEVFIPKLVSNNQQQTKSHSTIIFSRANICIPLFAQEPLVDPRLIYRLQAITTDLRWPSPCTQCSILPHLPSLFTSPTQTISFDPKYSSDFLDPRRESLKNAILNNLYHRLVVTIPNLFMNNSTQSQQFLFEQTIFKTNCSLHLEYLLHKIKTIDDSQFFHLIRTNDEFQLSPFLLHLIFN